MLFSLFHQSTEVQIGNRQLPIGNVFTEAGSKVMLFSLFHQSTEVQIGNRQLPIGNIFTEGPPISYCQAH
jgi:hypothetical protein